MAKDELFDQLGDFIRKGSRSIRDRFTLDTTDLLRAVDDSDIEEVERALRAGVDPNKDDGIGRFALPIAVDNNHTGIIRLLLAAKANPNVYGRDGQSALFKAVNWENAEIVTLLLKAGADVHQPNKDGKTPHEEARSNGYMQILALLNGHYDDRREEQLARDKAKHEAMKAKAEKARQEQIEKAQQQEERAQNRTLKKVERKYELKDENYLQALIKAIREEQGADAEVLLDKINDLNVIDPDTQTTPLMAAILNKQNELTQLLIEKGADCFLVVPKYHHSPLSYAVGQNYFKLVQLMLQSAKDTTTQLNEPAQLLSPQFMAYKDPRLFNLLLEAGADPFFGGQEAPPPVVKAIEKASVAILPVLVRNKVDLNQRTNAQTPLEWAIQFERQDWLIGLLKEGADIDLRDKQGYTALMKAIKADLPEFVAILLEENADTTLRNAEGQTALELAQSLEGKEQVVAMLESYQ